MENVHDIYDRIGKRCLSLSQRSTLNLINGLYGTEYPLDSEVTWHWTEHEDGDLRKTLADTVIIINHTHFYHIELQSTKDDAIALRIFEYGFGQAIKSAQDFTHIRFPNPILIYLGSPDKIPDMYELQIEFADQGSFMYKVPVLLYQKLSVEELNRRKMIVLIPFQLLKLRETLAKARTQENIDALQRLISHDIIEAVRMNQEAGNITASDARKLKRMTLQLYHHLYDQYEELEQGGVSDTVEEALILDIDVIEQEHKAELQEKEKEIEGLILDIDVIEQEHKAELQEKEKEIEGLILDIDVIEQEHKAELQEKEKEIEGLILDIDVIEQEHKAELQEKEKEIEGLILDIDVIEQEHKTELQEKEKEIEGLILDIDVIEQEHKAELQEKEKQIDTLEQKLEAMEREILRLKKTGE